MNEPKDPIIKEKVTELTKAHNSIYNARINLFIKEEINLKSAMTALYNMKWGQFSPMTKDRLESLLDYDTIRKDSNVASLLKEIKGVSNKLEVSSNVYDTLDEAKRKYYSYSQQFEDTNTKNVKAIKDLVATIQHYGGSICNDIGLIKHEMKKE